MGNIPTGNIFKPSDNMRREINGGKIYKPYKLTRSGQYEKARNQRREVRKWSRIKIYISRSSFLPLTISWTSGLRFYIVHLVGKWRCLKLLTLRQPKIEREAFPHSDGSHPKQMLQIDSLSTQNAFFIPGSPKVRFAAKKKWIKMAFIFLEQPSE